MIAESRTIAANEPTEADVLDRLFSRRREDPEALYLARRLRPLLRRYLRKGTHT